jgi:hypothetical protein
MPSRRSRKVPALALQSIELGLAVPEVLAHRLLRIATAGATPSLRDREEIRLMGIEKVAAFYESWNAMLVELARANLQLSLSSARSLWFPWFVQPRSSRAVLNQLQRMALAVLGQGVAPIRRRAAANAKRLRRARR